MIEAIRRAQQFRHACKDFDVNKIIDPEVFKTILDAGRLSPSSFGFEPWRFLVVQNPEIRQALKAVTWGGQNQIPHCSHLVVYLAKKKPLMDPDSHYIRNFMREVQQFPDKIIALRDRRYRNFLKNDFALYDRPELMFAWACRQVYIALANMMTSAALLEVDSCPMEGFDAEAMNEAAVEFLGMNSSEYGVACLCAFGYRVREPRQKTRQPEELVVKWFE